MSCDPQTLATSSRCLLTLSPRQLYAAWAYLVCSGTPVPPADEGRILEDDSPRVVETGDRRVIESQ